MKVNSHYSALEQKVTVFCTIYFPASSYPVFVLFLCKITMVALEWCNPYSIRPWVRLFWERATAQSLLPSTGYRTLDGEQ